MTLLASFVFLLASVSGSSALPQQTDFWDATHGVGVFSRWTRTGNPCDRLGEALVDLSAPTPTRAWALCSGLYGLGNDAKAIYETRDRGGHWSLVISPTSKAVARRLAAGSPSMAMSTESRCRLLGAAGSGKPAAGPSALSMEAGAGTSSG